MTKVQLIQLMYWQSKITASSAAATGTKMWLYCLPLLRRITLRKLLAGMSLSDLTEAHFYMSTVVLVF